MTEKDQIKALAELDGWTLAIQKNNCFGVAFRMRDAFNKPIWEDELPPYLTSYDAIIPLIQKQPATIKGEVRNFCVFECNGLTIEATPSQLCEALLRATGKWKD